MDTVEDRKLETKEPEQKPKSKWDYSDEYNDRQWMRTVGYGTPDGRHFKDDNDH